MKKILLIVFIIIFGSFLYSYQTPIIHEIEAVSIALDTLKNPPPEWKSDNSAVESIREADLEAFITDRTDSFRASY